MLLAIDTATPACSVALIEGDQLIDERHEVVGRGHAEKLVPMIEELIGRRRPQGVLVDCGPGSFTGVRVGLAAAHGLAIGWAVPLYGYSSLALMAAGRQEAEVASALQAGHGQIFVQSFSVDPLAPADEMRSLVPEEAARSILAPLIVGNAAQLLIDLRGYGTAVTELPRAADVRLMPAAMRNLPPKPIYGREPDAKPMS